MDAIQFLRRDQRKAKELLEKLSRSGGAKTTKRLFNEVRHQLETHFQIKEEIFYHALQDADATADLVEDAFDHHHEVRKALQRLSDMDHDDARWHPVFAEMAAAVAYHMDEEERHLFFRAQRVLSAEAVRDLGARMQQRRERLRGWSAGGFRRVLA